MFAYIRGELAERNADHIVIDVGGIGYLVYTPGMALEQMPSVGAEVKVYTYFQVKEDAVTLYGFLRKDDLDIFKMLIGINGIGPKGALAILSAVSADDLRFAILSGDVKAICKAPGIGQKIAQRVILELKDKLSLEDAMEMKLSHGQDLSAEAAVLGQVRDDAVLALTALGYSQSESLHAVREVEVTEGMDVEDVLRGALKHL